MINTNLLKQLFNSLNIEEIQSNDSIFEFIDEIDIYQKGFSSNEYSDLIKIREYKIGFTNRLMYNYSRPIQELEIFLEICKTIGNNIFKRIKDKDNSKTEALKRLYQKSCLVSSEIVYLIKGGYSSASFSRWRTLLETSIIALFLALNDETLSKRYLDYEIIDTKKELDNYKENLDFLGFEEIPESKEKKIEERYNAILDRYEESFKNSNGWASQVLNKKKPNLHDFMDYLNLEYIKPFYKFSNNYVHSGAKSLMFNLGYIDGVYGDNTISAESNIGFTDPAQLCMLSFFNSTIAFLSISPTEEDLITILGLYNKINYIAELFSNIEKDLIKKELNS